MSLGDELKPHLPFLRRYARALTGSQVHGDNFVRATLEAIVAAPEAFPRDVDPRLGLYRTFHAIWSSANIEEEPQGAGSGEAEGIAQANADRPDLILMDMSLPEIDGWEATRRLKADPATRHIPVIALTAHAMATDEQKAREAGCDDFDTKPVDLTRLLEKVTAQLERAGRA